MTSCSAIERPKLVETIAWAAANGDRSENGDYIYGRKRLREIDRRMSHLSRIMKAAKVVDPAAQQSRDQVRFGATVELADEDDQRRTRDHRRRRRGGRVGGPHRLECAARAGADRREGRRRADRALALGRKELRDHRDPLSRQLRLATSPVQLGDGGARRRCDAELLELLAA